MKIKTSELIGPALNWAVAEALGLSPVMRHDHMRAKAAANNYQGDLAWHLIMQINAAITVDESGVTSEVLTYSTSGDTVIEIMEREGIDVLKRNHTWMALHPYSIEHKESYGPTLRIAVCRCYVASKLGDEVDIPEELLK